MGFLTVKANVIFHTGILERLCVRLTDLASHSYRVNLRLRHSESGDPGQPPPRIAERAADVLAPHLPPNTIPVRRCWGSQAVSSRKAMYLRGETTSTACRPCSGAVPFGVVLSGSRREFPVATSFSQAVTEETSGTTGKTKRNNGTTGKQETQNASRARQCRLGRTSRHRKTQRGHRRTHRDDVMDRALLARLPQPRTFRTRNPAPSRRPLSRTRPTNTYHEPHTEKPEDP